MEWERGEMELEMMIPEEARLKYIERRKKDIESLREALSSNSFDEFKRVGHQLKGNAASFGYSDLEKIAIQLEAAGMKQDRREALQQVDLFEQWYTKVLS